MRVRDFMANGKMRSRTHKLLARQLSILILVEILEALSCVFIFGEAFGVFFERQDAVGILVPSLEGDSAVRRRFCRSRGWLFARRS